MKVSIIVPVYNVELYLDRCVESIINQTYKNLEIILVNDGSTDNSGILCEAWKERDERIIVIHKKNAGLSSARNVGIECATGDYYGFVDSDDYIDLNMYEELMHGITCYHKRIASCGRIVHYFDGKKKFEYCLNEIKLYTKDEAISEVLVGNEIDVSACDKVYHKDLFKDIQYPVGETNEDAAIILQLLDCSDGVVHVGKPLYNYIFRKNSISKSKYSHNTYIVYQHCIEMKNYIKKKHSKHLNDLNVYCVRVSCSVLQNMYLNREVIQEYPDDYNKFLNLFKDNIKFFFMCKKITKKEKIRALFVMLKIYPVYDFLRKILRR